MDQARSLAALLESTYGARSFPVINEMVSTVGTALVNIAKGKPRRAGLVIFNTSPNTIYIGPFQDVSASKGIPLIGAGAGISLVWDRDLELISQPWFAIATVAASSILILENVLDG